jgi:uncharacterized protein YndB with AHSA1/START domain
MGVMGMTQGSVQRERELVITREFDAPREEVWRAWTEPALLKQWWGPEGFTAPHIENDLRVGGKYLYAMRSPDGKDYWSTGRYLEIVPLQRIVSTDSFADEHGNVVPGSHYGLSADLPLESRITVTFEDHDGGTRVTIRGTTAPTEKENEDAREGWRTSLDKLEKVLRG